MHCMFLNILFVLVICKAREQYEGMIKQFKTSALLKRIAENI